MTSTASAPLEPPEAFDAVARRSASGAVWTTISRVTGLVRLMTIGAVLGPTYFGNLFQAANTLPNVIVYELLLGALIAPLLVPALVRRFEAGDGRGASALAGGFLGAGLVVVVPTTALLVLGGPFVVDVLTAGVQDAAARHDLRSAGWPLMALLLPQVVLYFVAATGAAVQNARGRFALAAAAPAAENAGVVATLLYVEATFGGRPADDPGLAYVLVLAGGTTAAVGLHALVQWFAARRVGVLLVPRGGWRDPGLREVLSLARPSVWYAVLSVVRVIAVLTAVGSVQGGVVAFQMGLQLAVLPVALFARPIAAALLPRLSQAEDRGDLRDDVVRGVRLYALLAVPAALGLLVLAGPLGDLLAVGEMATPAGRALLGTSIVALSLCVWGDGLFVLATSAAYARRDAARPLRGMALRAGLAVVGMAASYALLDGTSLLLGLGLSLALADLVASAWLTGVVLSGMTPGREPMLRPLLRTSVSSLVVVVPALVLVSVLDPDASSATLLAGVAGAVVLGSVLHAAVQLLRPESDLWLLRAGLRPGRGRGRRAAEPASRPAGHGGDVELVLGLVAVGTAVTAAGVSLVSLPLAAALAVGVVLVAVVVLHPPAAVYLYLALAPLVAGMERGGLVPLLRPSEVLLLLLGSAAAARLGVRAAGRRRRPGPAWHPTALDLALLAVLVTSSVVPLLWLAARGLPVQSEEALYAAVMVKCVALYALARLVIRTAAQVGTCLWIIVVSSAVVGVLALAQSLQAPVVFDVLAAYTAPAGDVTTVDVGRGGSTLGSAIAVGDLMAVSAAICVTWLVLRRQGPRTLVAGLCGLFVVGAVGTGQFSALLALAVCVLTVGVLTGTTSRVVRLVVPALGVAVLVAWPVVQGRLADLAAGRRVPRSWTVRLENLETYFWPRLFSSDQWLLGVTPSARVPEPRYATGYVWIESGHTWLLWTGGVPLLVAFLVLVVAAVRRTARAVRVADPRVSTAAVASCASWVLIAVLTTFDPHLTMRGVSDLVFPLLALATIAVPPSLSPSLSPSPSPWRGTGSRTAPVRRSLQRGGPLLAKRVLDVVLATAALLVLSPLLLLIAVAVKLEDGGPVLYRGCRVGMGGRRFMVLKFRSMRHRAGDHLHREHIRRLSARLTGTAASSVKIEADPRITRVGGLLRRLSLDELPQLVNVLAGDMSLVGPRPEVPYALEHYEREDLTRFAVLPGITGLWQVSGRSRLGQREMLALDRDYALSWSLRRDWALLLRTPAAVLRGDGAR